MKIAIVGSRSYARMDKVVDYVYSLPTGTTIVSGGARGVDSVAESTARELGLDVIVFPAKWDMYGRSAGFKRNALIVAESDEVVAFWDKKSNRTKNTIDLATKAGKPVRIIE